MSWADSWAKAGEAQDDYEPKKGAYSVQIVDGRAFEAKSDGREWISITLEVKEGPDAGRRFDHFGPGGDHNPVGFRIMREALLGYGVDLEVASLDELSDAIFEAIGTRAEISVSYSEKGFRQIRVTGSRTGKSDLEPAAGAEDPFGAAAAPAAAPKADDDEIPF